MIKKEIYDFYFPVIKKYRGLFILMGISGLISGISSVGLPILLKMETDQLVSKMSFIIFGKSFSGFEIFILILFIILFVDIIEKILSSITDLFLNLKKDLLKNDIQLNLYKKMEKMEIGRTMNSRYKYISDIVDSDFPAFSDKIIGLPKNIIEFAIELLGITAIYAYFDIKLLLIVIGFSIVGYFIEVFSRKIINKYEVEWRFTLGRQIYKYSSLFLYRFSDLAISGGLGSTLDSYSNLLSEENKNSIKKDFASLIWNVNELVNFRLRDICLKLIVGYGVFVGTSSVGMVVLVVSSMGTLGGLVSQILSLRTNYKDLLFQQESILLMLRMCIQIGNIKYEEKINEIEFKNIFFTYPNLAKYEKEYFDIVQKYIIGSEEGKDWISRKINQLLSTIDEDIKTSLPKIFSGINLKFKKGEVYGLVGKNGAGKTTLMYLLSGFYREYSGEIFFNGKNTKNFTTSSFLDKISFLTQTPFYLDWGSTIRENIFLGTSKNITDEKAWEYLDLFGLSKKIKKHKKMLDAEIGNDIEFSGGEEQILSFIRLLLQDRDIIIMDEGTNQLDAENEILVMNELLKNKHDKIIIFITHRMSTISKADEIYCLEDGKISHTGNHKELLKAGDNIYAKFYKAQVLHE